MKIFKYIILIFIILWLLNIWFSNAYMFWFKSSDNTVENVLNIEDKYDTYIPMVSFIFEDYDEFTDTIMNSIPTQLGKNRIYHITLSPNWFTAKDVAEWKFDEKYIKMFQIIKKYDLKVIFRTMHEMNWWWFIWSWDPKNYKKAWKRMRLISQKLWLDNNNILFVFSVNHWDSPSIWTPSKTSQLIECNPKLKSEINCLSFEDYYPGDKYVDIMWVTFYNWWKATSGRKWLSPSHILYDKNRNTLERLKSYWKNIFIDEVWTTAVKYNTEYYKEQSIYQYNNNLYDKNNRLIQLKTLLENENQIIWTIYFNVDYTFWLQRTLIWEADWSVIDLDTNKLYDHIFKILNWSELNNSKLLDMFNSTLLEYNWKKIIVNKLYEWKIKTLIHMAIEKWWKNKTLKWISWFYDKIDNNKKINENEKKQWIYIIDKVMEIFI